MEEPKLKKKIKFQKSYLYIIIIITLFIGGITYGLTFFEFMGTNEDINQLSSGLVDLDISEVGTITLSGTRPMMDEEGLNNTRQELTITNNSATCVNVKISLINDPDNISTIEDTDIRYATFIEGNNNYIDYLSSADGVIYEGLINEDSSLTLEFTIWLDYFYENMATNYYGIIKVDATSYDMTASEYIGTLADKNKHVYAVNTSGGLYNGTGTIQEYRYSGNDVDNYVSFNRELWRILYAKVGNGVTLVRDELLDSISGNGVFNMNGTEFTYGSYYNYDSYYNNKFLYRYNSSAINTWNTSNIYNVLNYRGIGDMSYFGLIYMKYLTYPVAIRSSWANHISSPTISDTLSMLGTTTDDSFEVGMITISDYGYSVDPIALENAWTDYNLSDPLLSNYSWLDIPGSPYWTMTTSNTIDKVYVLNETYIKEDDVTNITNYGLRPVVNLQPDIKIISGSGTYNDPYQFNLQLSIPAT